MFLTLDMKFLITIFVFLVLALIAKFLAGKINLRKFFSSSKFFNPNEYLPEEKHSSVKQVFYLIMIIYFVINILYLVVKWKDGTFNFLILDIIVSLYLIVKADMDSFKSNLIVFLLIPFGSISYLIFGDSWIVYFDYIHCLVFIYYIKVYYRKFVEYTQNNSLRITIMLLFLLTFVSFFITIIVEDVSPLDSIVMVSNAITSNGYTVLGHSGWGKINSLLLVWMGFLLSAVGTATLAVSIILRSTNQKFDELEDSIKRNRKK